MILLPKTISVAARASRLSRAQVQEVLLELRQVDSQVKFTPTFFMTTGDADQATSLLTQEGTDFFTKEIDEAVLKGVCRIGIHSAKDLPDELPSGLATIAYTKGVDPSDVLVFRTAEDRESLQKNAKVGTSSLRRIENIRAFRDDLVPVDIRGTIEKRLELLDSGVVDALVIAKAALIRLQIQRETMLLPGRGAARQGSLAVVAKEDDHEMKALFAPLNRFFL